MTQLTLSLLLALTCCFTTAASCGTDLPKRLRCVHCAWSGQRSEVGFVEDSSFSGAQSPYARELSIASTALHNHAFFRDGFTCPRCWRRNLPPFAPTTEASRMSPAADSLSLEFAGLPADRGFWVQLRDLLWKVLPPIAVAYLLKALDLN